MVTIDNLEEKVSALPDNLPDQVQSGLDSGMAFYRMAKKKDLLEKMKDNETMQNLIKLVQKYEKQDPPAPPKEAASEKPPETPPTPPSAPATPSKAATRATTAKKTSTRRKATTKKASASQSSTTKTTAKAKPATKKAPARKTKKVVPVSDEREGKSMRRTYTEDVKVLRRIKTKANKVVPYDTLRNIYAAASKAIANHDPDDPMPYDDLLLGIEGTLADVVEDMRKNKESSRRLQLTDTTRDKIMSAVNTQHVYTSVQLIRRYLSSFAGKAPTQEQVGRFAKSIRTAIEKNKVRESDPYRRTLDQIMDVLEKHEQGKKLPADLINHGKADQLTGISKAEIMDAVSTENINDSVKQINRYLSKLARKAPKQEQIISFSKSLRKAIEKSKAREADAYQEAFDRIMKMLEDYQQKKRAQADHGEVEINSLTGSCTLEGMCQYHAEADNKEKARLGKP